MRYSVLLGGEKMRAEKPKRLKITTYILPEYYQLLQEIASRTGITIGTLLNYALTKFFAGLEIREEDERFLEDLEFIKQRTADLRQKKKD